MRIFVIFPSAYAFNQLMVFFLVSLLKCCILNKNNA